MAKWRDKREVTFISTEYSAAPIEVPNRRGEGKIKPEAIIKYNKFMSGVDHNDQMLVYNAADRKTIRWYKKLVLNTLQILLLNSWYLHSVYSTKKVSFYEFRLNIIENLLGRQETPKPTKLPEIVHLPSQLQMSEGGKTMRKDCRICRTNKNRKATNFCCTMCPDTPGLCLEPCFRIFHKY